MERLAQDIRYAFRSFRKRPTFTVVIVATLALGIGANTAIFTIVNELLLRPLPLGAPDELVDLYADVPGGNSFTGFSYPEYIDYRDGNDVLSGLAAFMGVRVDVGPRGNANETAAQFSSGNYFDVLRVGTVLGRSFLPEEGARGSNADVVVISDAYWRGMMGADSNVVGSTILINNMPVTVVGVARRGFQGTFIGFPMSMWLPLPSAERLLTNVSFDDRSAGILEFVGRLKPGVTAVSAESAFDVMAERLEREHPNTVRGKRVGVAATTGIDHSMRAGVTGFLGVLLVVAGLVLLVTCLNVSGMMLARSTGRQKEMTIRLAVGASRWRLIRQLLTEATVLFVLGGLIGSFVASRAIDLLLLSVSRLALPIGFDLPMDWRVLSFTAAAALIAAILAGLYPAREALRQDASAALRTREGEDRRTNRLRAVFVVTQIAGAVILLVGAGLFVRSVVEGVDVDLGFDADRVATTPVTLPVDRYTEDRAKVFFTQLSAAARSIPGVEAMSLAARRPLGVARNPIAVDIPGYQIPSDVETLTIDANFVTADYLSTLGVTILDGRDLQSDDVENRHNVVVVNQSAANRFWPNQSVIGRSMTIDDDVFTVVGVARDSRYRLQDALPTPHAFLPASVRASPTMNVVLRASGDPVILTGQVQSLIAELDPELTVQPLVTLRETMNNSLLPQRLAAGITGSLGLFGFFLASLGIYGILAHAVGTRTKEIGVRIALGGLQRNVRNIIVMQGMRLVLVGVLLGVVTSLLIMPLLSSFLVAVSPADVTTFLVVSGLFVSVAAVACYLPARRASRIDPASVLRIE